VRSLVLVTPFVQAAPRLLAVLQAWSRLAREVGAGSLAHALLPWFFASQTLADPKTVERLARGLGETLGRVSFATLERSARGLRAWSGSRPQDLQRIAIPTLVIAGAEDLLTPDAATLAQRIPEARCLVVPNAGHAVGLEAAELVNPAILEHLARN
jgi:3-oxoadipate enol-lactonase